MSARLPTGGRLIDRHSPVAFSFDGTELLGCKGDTLASALLANNQTVVGRSFKYHRPRGIVASGVDEPNALVSVGDNDQFEPNLPATTVELRNGLKAQSQNRWPSLKYDIGALSGLLSPLFPAGFYYKTFMEPRVAWKHVFEPLIRRAAGLGQPPSSRDPDRYEHFHAHVDVLIVGAGIAGLLAAKIAGEAGAKVLLLEQSPTFGGRSPVDDFKIDGRSASEWIQNAVDELSSLDNVRIRTRTTAFGVYDHGYILANEKIETESIGSAPRRRFWRIRAKKTILATGAFERPICFKGNDVPGVMLASAARDYVSNFGVSPGDRTVLVTNNDDAYRTAITLLESGLDVPVVLDTRPRGDGALVERLRDYGTRIEFGKGVASVTGQTGVKALAMCSQAGEGTRLETIECDTIAVSGGWSPTVHLWSHCGGKLIWDDARSMFRPRVDYYPVNSDGSAMVHVVGAANGDLTVHGMMKRLAEETDRALRQIGFDPPVPKPLEIEDNSGEDIQPVWRMPYGMDAKSKSKAWVDYQNDVTIADIELAAREGYRSAEHAKRYTTLGMATDQGKTSNINGLGTLANRLGIPIDQVGTTTFRPPFTPVELGAIAGDAHGELFKPLRKTVLDAWHDDKSAYWEPVADWRRPYCYLKLGEAVSAAVRRECLRVRTSVGIMDASTLGKIIVSGADSGKFLDMIYTNMMSTLKPGRCRYGLMCNENGFLIDDGVVARIDDDTFLCHTTTGGADNIYAWMEEWLQTEWWEWRVHTANLTEQFAQIVVAGPDARNVLTKIVGDGVDADNLPFMSWVKVSADGLDMNIFRISFSGELSFEIAVRASRGLCLWNRILECGEEFQIEPYGTEALHVLRAEKGFIMIGDESDGTVTPQDLGLHWAISKKKTDFLGKRAQERPFLNHPKRWKLVGLETLDSKVPLASGSHAIGTGENVHGHKRMIGRVTSSYFSPILNRAIALGLVENGPDRMDEVLDFVEGDKIVKAKVVNPVFYDRDGTQQNA